MQAFTSERERRLWLWALAVMVAIYSTLGPARVLIDALRERNLLRVSFWVVVLLVVVAIVVPWIRKRPGWSEIGVALGVAFAYWVTLIRIENPGERTHLIEYGIVAALIHQALLERVRNGRHVPTPATLTVAVTAALGLIDEGIQRLLPSRVFDWNDVLFNALAGFMVIVARLAIAPVQRPGWRLWFLWLMAGAIGWGWSLDPGSFGLPTPVVILDSVPRVEVPRPLSLLVGATVVGVLQWLVLRRYLARAVRWAPTGVAAAVLSLVATRALGLLDPELGLVAGLVLYGTLAGVLQWLVLRGEVRGGGWWVLASTVGWIVAVPMGDAMGPPGWAVFGAITGTAMVVLMRRQAS